MGRNQRCGTGLVWLAAPLVLALALLGRAAEPDELLKAVQGKWVRFQNAPGGKVTLIKEHRDQKTILTAYDERKRVLYSHTSEFTVEQSGRVKVFTFRNRTVTAGPDKGQQQKEPMSYVYRVVDGKFLEVRGVLDDDPNPPAMILWEPYKGDLGDVARLDR